MRGRVFQSKLWKDAYYQSLNTDKERVLFLYFLFNENITIIHLYEAPDWETMAINKLDPEELKKIKAKFQKDGKMYFYKEWVYLTNAHRYQEYKGDSNEKAKRNLIRQLPTDVLDWYNKIKDSSVGTGGESAYNSNHNINSNRNSKGYKQFLKAKEKLVSKKTAK